MLIMRHVTWPCSAGVVLTTVMLVAATLLGNVAKDLVLEVMARADYLYHRKVRQQQQQLCEGVMQPAMLTGNYAGWR